VSNDLITPTIIAQEALMQLDNNLVFGSMVHRGYEDEFGKMVNGSKPGDTIRIRKPVQFTVRSGAVADVQDVEEAYTSMTVGPQIGVDFKFQSSDFALTIAEFSDRYIKPAMIQIANTIDTSLAALYKDIPNWTGPTSAGVIAPPINSFADFAKAPERLDLLAVPQEGRMAALSPSDHWGLLGSFTGIYINDVAKSALERAKLPPVGGVDCYSAQNVQTHTVGAYGGTTIVNAPNQGQTYSTVKNKNLMTQTITTQGWTTNSGLNQGDVITIDGVYDVNPVTKATLPHLKQFVLTADVTTNTTSTNTTTLTISPALITTGPYQNVSADMADSATITYMGTASTGYAQNLVFRKEAFALAIVPMVRPAGAVDVVSESYKNISVRLIPYYDGTNDVSNYRLDVLPGYKTLDQRLATRASGS
jgi:P22 coat protein - gene protein 5